jgi:hypothetical protein
VVGSPKLSEGGKARHDEVGNARSSALASRCKFNCKYLMEEESLPTMVPNGPLLRRAMGDLQLAG